MPLTEKKMFPAVSAVDLTSYDFSARENELRWKGLFINGLKKVNGINICISMCIFF